MAVDTWRPVGLVAWSGPDDAVAAGWWIGVKGRGYGKAAVRLLAREMAKTGVASIGRFPIDGASPEFAAASGKLAQALREEFGRLRGAERPPQHRQEA